MGSGARQVGAPSQYFKASSCERHVAGSSGCLTNWHYPRGVLEFKLQQHNRQNYARRPQAEEVASYEGT